MAWKRRNQKSKALKTDQEIDAEFQDVLAAWSDHLSDDDRNVVEFVEGPIPDDCELSASERGELRDVLEELHRRENESLKLYEPMPGQEAFHASFAPERLLLGGNRGGKTLGACVEIARAVTGQDPFEKYDAENGIFVLVGKDQNHNGRVLFRKLFHPNPFRVIYDPVMCKLRAFRPWLEWDQQHVMDTKPAGPLIPTRLYSQKDGITWENARDMIPKSATIKKTGWKILIYSGQAAPPNGLDVHAAAFDEEIEHPAWYTEVAARLLDHRMETRDHRRFVNGRFWWSATPQAGTQHLFDLFERAEKAEGEENPPITKHEATLLTNVHITEDAKQDLIEKLKNSDDEYQVRVEGRFAILGSRVYPEFMPRGIHGCATFPIPSDWTRYAAIDPGRQVAAVLFAAVPPPGLVTIDVDGKPLEVRGRKIIYDELYIRRCSAAIFAERLAAKVGSQVIQRWWIDMHAGRVTEMGSGLTVAQQYSDELKKRRVGAIETGHDFAWARDDAKAGIEAVKRGLYVREDGKSEWLVMWESVPSMIEEARKYCFKRLANTRVVTDEPVKRDDHLMDTWRYLAMANLRYVDPLKSRKQKKSYAVMALEEKRSKRKGGVGVKVW